jgi:hypothetical protein
MDKMKMEMRTVCEHLAMVWNDLSVLEQLFLHHPTRGTEHVEVGYGCCLTARTFAEEFGRLLKETKDMEGNVQPGGDRVKSHTNFGEL